MCGMLIECRRKSRVLSFQSVKLEKLIPPWTVTQKVYTESLTSRHSGISKDILLFSDIGLSLAHHYRVHKKGVPHIAFHKNNMSQLRAMLPLPAAQFAKGGRRSLVVRQWRIRRRLWAVIIDRPDVRSLADAYPGSDRHPHESHLA